MVYLVFSKSKESELRKQRQKISRRQSGLAWISTWQSKGDIDISNHETHRRATTAQLYWELHVEATSFAILNSGKPKASLSLLFIPCSKTCLSVGPGGNSFQNSSTLATSHHPTPQSLVQNPCSAKTRPLLPCPAVPPINLFVTSQTLLCTMYFYVALSVKVYACNIDIWEAEVGGSQISRLQSRSLSQMNK